MKISVADENQCSSTETKGTFQAPKSDRSKIWRIIFMAF